MKIPNQFSKLKVKAGDIDISAKKTVSISPDKSTVPSKQSKLLYKMDRRPIWNINTFGGVRNSDIYPEENKWGCNPDWRGPEGVDWLINSHIKPSQQSGCDRFFINRPAGGAENHDVSFASWHVIPPNKRAAILNRLTNYILDESPRPIDLCYYIGIEMADFRTAYPYSESNPDMTKEKWKFDSDDDYSLMGIRASLGGLMAGGMTTLGLDAASTEKSKTLKIATELYQNPFKIKTIGEAIPLLQDIKGNSIKDSNGYFIPDLYFIERMPWLAMMRFIDSAFDQNYKFDPEVTEVYIFMEGNEWNSLSDQDKEENLWKYMQRGFIPIVYGQRFIEKSYENADKLNWFSY